jgi:hypothetical protein
VSGEADARLRAAGEGPYCAAILCGVKRLPCAGLARFFKGIGDTLEHRVDLAEHFIVPDPQHHKSGVTDKLSSTFVLLNLISVLRTIELDNELCFQAKEVCDEWPYRILPAELETF